MGRAPAFWEASPRERHAVAEGDITSEPKRRRIVSLEW